MNNKQKEKENKLKEIMNKEIDAKLFNSILTGATISAISAVFAVKVKERINRFEDDCKVDNSTHFFCFAYLNENLKLLIFFFITLITAVLFGIVFYYLFDKK